MIAYNRILYNKYILYNKHTILMVFNSTISLLLNTTLLNNCSNGIWNESTQQCTCNNNWYNANFIDIVFNNMLNNTQCTQFKCETDNQCQSLLNISDSKCLIKNQNCYCGIKYALKNDGIGFKNKNAMCMGGLYVINIKLIFLIEYILTYSWKQTLYIALAFIFIGQKRILDPRRQYNQRRNNKQDCTS